MDEKKIEFESSLKLIAKTSIIAFIGLILSKLFGYIFRVIIARNFGPEVYGLFSLSLTISGFFIAIAAMGFLDGLLRYIPLLRSKKDFNEIRYLFKRTTQYFLIIGIIAALILYFSASLISVNIFHDVKLIIFLKIISALILINLFLNAIFAALRGFERIGWLTFFYHILNNGLRVLVLVLLLVLGFKSPTLSVWSVVIAALLTLASSYIFCRYKLNQLFGSYVKKDYSSLRKEFINYSWPIMFYSIVSTIFYWIDTFSLGYYKSTVEVGLYNAAVPIAMLIIIMPDLFSMLFFPLINREYSNKNFKLIEQLSKQVTKWIFMATLPIVILIFFFPGAALNIIFGPEYIKAENALRLLLIGSFINSLFTVPSNLISMIGKSKVILFNLASATIMNLVLNYLLVPMPTIFSIDNSSGMVGAALATLISIIFLNVLFLFEIKRFLSFLPFRRKMIPIGLIALFSTIVLFYLRNNININIFTICLISGLFLLLYAFLIIITRSLDENDWMIIRSTLKKFF